MSNRNICPIILCGGSGTRLWPLSRSSFPKQFLTLSNEDNKSLLQKTLIRISGLKNLDKPILICNEEHRFIVAEQLREINIVPKLIILEPFGRNTAPAITIAALQLLKENFDPHLIVLSSDHEIKEKKKIFKCYRTFTNLLGKWQTCNFWCFTRLPRDWIWIYKIF